MISKTKIDKRIKRKTNLKLVGTIELAKKNNHLILAKKLSQPTRNQSKINLNDLNKLKESKVIVVGKVLGQGETNKKINISALSFSKQAMEKLKRSGSTLSTIKKYLENNKDLKGVKVI